MAYLHTILAYPSKPRLKGALNRIYGYLSRYRAGTDKTLISERSFAPRGTLSPIGYFSSRNIPHLLLRIQGCESLSHQSA